MGFDMWDETNFLLNGFINEVKGALTNNGSNESGNTSGSGGLYRNSAIERWYKCTEVLN